MKAIKTGDLTSRTKEYLDEAAGGETFIISRPRNHNVVFLSEESYNLMRKAAELGQPILEKKQRKMERETELLAAQA